MSDEAHIEAAYRHADLTIRQQWHGMAPDEELMRKEEPEPEDVMEAVAAVQERFLVYCFADTLPEEWWTVAIRSHTLLKLLCYPMIALRPGDEIQVIRGHAREVVGFPIAKVLEEMREHRGIFERLFAHYFPEHREWLKHGVQNLYLIARNYQPGLVTRWDGRELSYERMAGVFGEIPLAPPGEGPGWIPRGWSRERWEIARDRARSRWSARAQQLISRPIQRAYGRAPALFGKGAAVREKYSQAAKGNQNRRKL